MQDLREIILLLNKHNIYPLKYMGNAGDCKSKMLALYEGIAKDKFTTDEDATQALYATAGDSSSYRKLKSELREKLLDAVLQINTEMDSYTDYQRAYYNCHKQWVIVRYLTGQNANMAALTLSNRLLRQAEKYDFTILCMDIASYLRTQYGLRESNDKRFRDANQLFNYYQKIYQAESLAEELYTTLIVRVVNNRSAQEEVYSTAVEYYERMEPALQMYQSYKLNMYGYMIGLMRYTTVNDHVQALLYCEQALQFFKSRPYVAQVPLQIFNYQHLMSNIHLERFDEAIKSAQHYLPLMQEGTFNWFKFKELYLLLLLRIQQYAEAAEVLASAFEHARFEFLPDNAKELWRIYESYLFYLSRIPKLNFSLKSKAFRLARFINGVPIFSKDKSGMNVAVLVIKFLLLLLEHKYSQMLDEVEAAEQYIYRHLRSAHTQRSYYFLKMLLQIPLGNFDVQTAQSRAERFREKLHAIPLQLANQTYEVEIVPYEDLWNYALDSLQKNAVK